MHPKIAFVAEQSECLDQLRGITTSMEREWELSFFENPRDALDNFKEHPVNVLVCDSEMTGMDSLIFCQMTAVKQRQNDVPLYTVYLTSPDDHDNLALAMESGIDDFVSKPITRTALISRIKIGLRVLASQVALANSRAQMIRLNIADPATGLYNKTHGKEIIEGEMARVQRGTQQLSLALVSIVNFDRVQDIYGADAGTTLLQEAASRIQQTSRRYDMLVRWSEGSLLIVCPLTNSAGATAAANRFRATIDSQKFRLGQGTLLTITANVTTLSTEDFPEITPEQLIKQVEAF